MKEKESRGHEFEVSKGNKCQENDKRQGNKRGKKEAKREAEHFLFELVSSIPGDMMSMKNKDRKKAIKELSKVMRDMSKEIHESMGSITDSSLATATMVVPEISYVAIIMPDMQDLLREAKGYLRDNDEKIDDLVVLAMSDVDYAFIETAEYSTGSATKSRRSLNPVNKKYFFGKDAAEVKSKFCNYLLEDKKNKILDRVKNLSQTHDEKALFEYLIGERNIRRLANEKFGHKRHKTEQKETSDDKRGEEAESSDIHESYIHADDGNANADRESETWRYDVDRLLKEIGIAPKINQEKIYFRQRDRTIEKGPSAGFECVNVFLLKGERRRGYVLDGRRQIDRIETEEPDRIFTVFKVPLESKNL